MLTIAACVGVIAITLVAIVARPATVIDRLETWRAACVMWLNHPLLGHGPGASLRLLGDNHADSLLITVLLENGALGLLAVVWLGVEVVRLCFSHHGTPARLALLAFGLHQVVDATLYMPGLAMLAGAALGLLTVHDDEVNREIKECHE